MIVARKPIQNDAKVPPNLSILQFFEFLLVAIEAAGAQFVDDLGGQELHLLNIVPHDDHKISKFKLV